MQKKVWWSVCTRNPFFFAKTAYAGEYSLVL